MTIDKAKEIIVSQAEKICALEQKLEETKEEVKVWYEVAKKHIERPKSEKEDDFFKIDIKEVPENAERNTADFRTA